MDSERGIEEPLMQAYEKDAGVADVSQSQRDTRKRRLVMFGSLLALGCFYLSYTGMPSFGNIFAPCSRHRVSTSFKGKVPLEAHIMSKCPDARDCLLELIVPFMEQHADLVDFKLSYIGEIHNSSEAYATDREGEESQPGINFSPDDSRVVTCMHGPMECLGNVVELCAAHLYPDPKIYLGFVNCLSLSYPQIPEEELVRDCALEHALNFDKLNECVGKDEGAFGMKLLMDSVRRSKEAGVRYSCTVRLDEEIRCIRDGGLWKDCPGGSRVGDLIRDVEKLAGKNGAEDQGERLDLIWT